MPEESTFRVRTRMRARSTDEEGRVSSPLELLFDLTFVVGIASIVGQLAHAIEAGTLASSLVPFFMVFFAIWWAWMNFTWFASSYDTDDLLYRIATMVQMAGVLVLAAGVPSSFGEHHNYLGITFGYLIMRIGLVAQWLRLAAQDPSSRSTALRYAAGIALVQVLWLLRLLAPDGVGVALFAVLAVLELAVPMWAERTGKTAWHPHHIAERYGLFTIIILGESVAAATTGVQDVVVHGLNWSLVAVGVSALVIIFAIWWIYFLQPSGEGLQRHRELSYLWGYGHYFIFASLAAVGAGLEVAVNSTGEHEHSSPLVAGYAIAIPVALFLVLVWAVHARIVLRTIVRPEVVLPAGILVLALPFAADSVGLGAVTLLIALVCVAVVTATIILKLRWMRAHGVST